jgi:hypothetical protein
MALRYASVAAACTLAMAQAGPGAPASGDGAQAWICDATSPRQQWLVETGNAFPLAHITLSKSFNASIARWLVLDISGWSNASGAAVHMWYNDTGSSGYNEQWSFDGSGAIVSRMNGHCLTVAAAAAGVAATMQNCSEPPTPLQTWQYAPATGLITLSADAHYCLDAGSSVNCSEPPLSGFVYCDPDASTEAC